MYEYMAVSHPKSALPFQSFLFIRIDCIRYELMHSTISRITQINYLITAFDPKKQIRRLFLPDLIINDEYIRFDSVIFAD